MTQFLQDVVFGAGAGAIDALLAMGIVLIFRTTGVLNFAQAATGTLAAYVAYSISGTRPLSSLWYAVPVSLAAGGLLGVLTFLAVRSIRSRQVALTAAVATLAIEVLIRQVIQVQYGATAGIFPRPLDPLTLTFGDLVIPGVYIGAIVAAGTIAAAVGATLRFTRVGTMIRAIADSPDAARLCGGNIVLLIGGVWAVAGMLAAVAGFFAAQFDFEPSFLDTFFVIALIAAVLGGLRSLSGAFGGAIALEVAHNLFLNYLPTWGQYAQTFLLLLLVAVLVFTPRERLLGSPVRAV